MSFNFLPSIDAETLANLPRVEFEGRIVMVETPEDAFHVAKKIKKYKILGFDTESKAAFKKGVKNKPSLIQISVEDTAYLFRIHKMGIPMCLIEIFENESILKVGVALHQDIKELQQLQPFKPLGFVDLQTLAGYFGITDKSLKKLAGIVLNSYVSKSQRLSNWNAELLSDKQLIYAATDAWISYKIYKKLKESEVKNKKETDEHDK